MSLHVLHIEDAPSDAILVRRAMERSEVDVEITHAPSADRGLELLNGGLEPDLVLLDLNLPGMSGHEFLGALRSMPRFAKLPVLVLTTSRNPADVHKAYQHHANAYYVKPSEFPEFVALAGSLLDHWSHRAVLPPKS